MSAENTMKIAPRVEVIAGKQIHVFPKEISNFEASKLFAKYESEHEIEDAFFAMNLRTVLQHYVEWAEFMPRVKPYFAVKCRDDPVLLKLLASFGAGFDVASRTEFELASQLVEPDRLVYANPIKNKSYVRAAREKGIKKMTFDTIDELDKIIAEHPKAEMILRFAPDDSTSRGPLSMKFGCNPVTEAPEILENAAKRGVAVVGISFHVGSGVTEAEPYVKAILEAKKLFDLGKKYGHNMHVLDIGGGYPGRDTAELTFSHIAGTICAALDKYFPRESGVKIMAEPGRYFAAAAFSLTANIIGRRRVHAARVTKDKDSSGDGFMYYLNDGVYGSFNCIIFDFNRPVGKLLEERKGVQYPSSIWGPTCDGADQVELNRDLPELNTGDWLYYGDMGAYTYSAATTFNGFKKTKAYYYMDEATWEAIKGKL